MITWYVWESLVYLSFHRNDVAQYAIFQIQIFPLSDVLYTTEEATAESEEEVAPEDLADYVRDRWFEFGDEVFEATIDDEVLNYNLVSTDGNFILDYPSKQCKPDYKKLAGYYDGATASHIGFFVFLEPQTPGNHEIFFKVGGPEFCVAAKFELTYV